MGEDIANNKIQTLLTVLDLHCLLPTTFFYFSSSTQHTCAQSCPNGGLPFPPPEDLPDPGTEYASLASPALAGRYFATDTTREASSFTNFLAKMCKLHLISPIFFYLASNYLAGSV